MKCVRLLFLSMVLSLLLTTNSHGAVEWDYGYYTDYEYDDGKWAGVLRYGWHIDDPGWNERWWDDALEYPGEAYPYYGSRNFWEYDYDWRDGWEWESEDKWPW